LQRAAPPQGGDTVRNRVLASLAALAVGCTQAPAYQVTRLPSGREIKVLGVTKMFFSQDDPALMLKYQTDLDLDDGAALAAEVEEVWQVFRKDAEAAQVNGAIILVSDAPKGFIVTTNNNHGFVFERSPDGAWRRKER
jgi:hypothetical protein